MNTCQFVEIEGNTDKYICSICGKEQTNYGRSCDMVVRICNGLSPNGKPYLLTRVSIPCKKSGIEKTTRWKKAIAKWTKEGKPTRSDLEVSFIYERRCTPCDFFNVYESCKLCGCKLSHSKLALFRKIRIATEHCPKKFW